MKETCLNGIFVILSIIAIAFMTTCNDPVNPSKPALAGQVSFINTVLRVSEPVTAVFNGNGTGEQAWKWYRITPGTEVELESNSSTYTPVISDIGFPLKAAVSFSDQSGSISAITTLLVDPVPTYGISLSETGIYTFPPAEQGYGTQTEKPVTVSNTGDQPTGNLSIELLGTNADNFTLSHTSLDSIASGGSISNAFTVVPNNDLSADTYIATIAVSGINDIFAEFNISFTVNAIVPSAPQNFTAAPGNAQAALSWAAPSDNGGSAIIGYQVSSDNGSTWVTASSNTSHTFSSLSNGTSYTFQVRAANSAGNGAAASATATPVTTPSAPQNFTATPDNAQVTLSWAAPSDNGGSAITGYQVSSDNGVTWVTASSNTGHTFTSLTNGTNYTFQVRAINAAGFGTESTQTSIPRAISMVHIPGGSFVIGKELGTAGSGNTTPISTVTLSGFYIGKYQVTQEQWAAVMEGNANNISVNPSYFSSNPASGEVQARRPVESVSWYDALVFCNRLSIAEGLTPAYSISGSTNPADWGNVPTSSNGTWNAAIIETGSTGYRLPTEAQWEYAAKEGTSQGAYTYSGSNDPDVVAWYTSNSSSMTHEVGKKQANELGLYDMTGNVFEWCWDWYDSYTDTPKTDPVGASSGSIRVSRGGSWSGSASSLRSVDRSYYYPYDRGGIIGFRLALPE